MRKIFTSLTRWSSAALLAAAAAFAPWQSADAQTRLLDENFDYPAGNLEGQGGWTVFKTNTEAPIQVVSTSLTYAGYQDEAVGGKAQLKNTDKGQDLYHLFANDTKVADGTVYVSFLLNVSEPITAEKSGWILNLAAETKKGIATGSFSNEVGRLFALKGSDDNHYKLGVTIGNASTNAISASKECEVGTTYLVVVGFNINPTTQTDDTCDLWINPATNLPVAPAADATNPGGSGDPSLTYGGLCAVAINQGTSGQNMMPACTIDALRVATA